MPPNKQDFRQVKDSPGGFAIPPGLVKPIKNIRVKNANHKRVCVFHASKEKVKCLHSTIMSCGISLKFIIGIAG